jgi:hypothetical protein
MELPQHRYPGSSEIDKRRKKQNGHIPSVEMWPFFSSLLIPSIRFGSKADAPFTRALLRRKRPFVVTTFTVVGSRDLLP